jgi:N-acetylglucosamine-6-sulfatase
MRLSHRRRRPLILDRRPNIVFVITDDQDANTLNYMPNLQAKLVSRGVTFRNSFVTDPLCCPSRATILRGQYVHNHGVETNTRPEGGEYRFRQLGRDRSTVATWLQDSGYRTALIGKYLNAYKDTYIPPGWDRWFATIGQATGHRFNDQGKRIQHSSEHLYEDIIAERAIEWLDRIASEQDPFFLYLAPHAPHQPATPAPRHADQFSKKRLPRPPNVNEQDVSDKPSWLRDKEPLKRAQIRKARELYRNRLRALLGVDDLVSQLVDSLQSIGKLDDTYIFYTSDHGFHLGEHRQKPGKRSPYEEDIRVPLVCRGPGIPCGETRDHLVINNDLAPTFAKLAGTLIPNFADGRSMVTLLGDNPPATGKYRQRFLFGQVRSKTRMWLWPIPTFLGVRSMWHSYVEYENGERELYNIQADPYQLSNIPKRSNKKLHNHMACQLASLRSCAGAGCRAAEAARDPWWRRILTGG